MNWTWQQILMGAGFVFIAWAVALAAMQRYDRKRLDLGNYRPTHDDRFPHRDEFTAFMRDCK